MTRTPTPGRPLRVLFTESPAAANWEPWGREMFEQLSRGSIPVLVDRDRPLADQVADPSIDAVVDMSFLASPELAAAAEGHVRLWQIGSVGFDKVDVASLARHQIPTANQPGFTSSRSLAEQALLLAMMVERSVWEWAPTIDAGLLGHPTGRQLAGRTLVIIGLGASGRQLVRRAVAFGMRVIGITRSGPNPDLERRAGLAWTAGLDRLDEALSQADVVSLHVPYSSETRHILDARRLALIRPGGVVVNVSRGGLIDELALLEAVRNGHLAGAGLDVVEGEPAPPDHPLRGAERIIMATHVAGATDATAHRRARFAALNVSRVRYGLEPLSRVDGLVRPS
jgi:phosphoglycerate dehydrogenase-like enzyme